MSVTSGEPEAVYEYVDELEQPLFEVVRFPGKEFRQRKPDGTWGLGDTRRVIYHLPRVIDHIESNSREPIFIVEGEKDVEAIESAGGVATCNPMGAGKWKDAYSWQLQGARRVVVVVDRDPDQADGRNVGLDHARTVVLSLAAVGIGAEVTFPRAGKDSSDHLDAGHTLADFASDAHELGATDRVDIAEDGSVFEDAFTFVERQTESPLPLLGDEKLVVIPAGGLVLLAGRPGSGKTTLVVDLACHLAAGIPWPPAEPNHEHAPTALGVPRPLRIALVENEGPEEMFRQKLKDKLDVFPHRIGRVSGDDGCLVVQTWRWGAFSFADSDSHRRAAEEMDDLRIDMIIGDPLASLGPAGVGSPADTRDFVALLRPLGLGTHRAFMFLHHFRERVERTEDELSRISGAWGGHLDTLLTLAASTHADRARLAWPKLRWARVAKPDPIILARVWDTAGWESIGTEGSEAMLENPIRDVLVAAQAEKRGRKGQGWMITKEIKELLDPSPHRTRIQSALEGAPHLFRSLSAEQAKILGARSKQTVLWGLTEWEPPIPDSPEQTQVNIGEMDVPDVEILTEIPDW